MLKVIELFAGVGAQVQGLKDANVPHEIVAISEIDKYALSVYEALHGAVNNLGDIRSIESLPRADLWTYSFPCTDISISGRMKGFEKESGTGSSLLWEVERLLEKARENGNLPKYLLMENVKNIVSKRFKPLFEEWIDYLSSLGYKSFYKVLNAKDYGVPQNRERCFMVSFLNYDGDFSFPNKVPLETKLSDLLEKDVAEKYFLSEKLITNFSSMENRNGFIRGLRFRPQFRDAPFGWTITTNPGSRATDNFIIEPIPCALRGRREEDGKIHQHLEIKKDGITNTLTTVTKDNLILEGLDNSKFMIPQAVKKGYALAEVGDGVYTNRCEFKRGVVQKKMIPTLKTTVSDIGVVVNDPQDLISIRRLTPRECWRLMGWKDESIDIAFITKVSETQLYKMAGNSIVVNCLTAIFKNLFGAYHG
jgi:DNA (cytosine-5)-methyltransferase 1